MGIKVCASQNENTSFGPVISNFGVSPLKNDVRPSFRAILDTIRKPLSGFSKFLLKRSAYFSRIPTYQTGMDRLLVLDTSLDDVEGSRDDQGSRGTGDGGNEVLGPGCSIVIGKTERFFGKRGTSKELYRGGHQHKEHEAAGGGITYRKRPRGVSGCSPAPSSV